MYVHVYLVYIYILQSENKPDPPLGTPQEM